MSKKWEPTLSFSDFSPSKDRKHFIWYFNWFPHSPNSFSTATSALQPVSYLSHPGVSASRRLIFARFVWPGMSSGVGLWARSCLPCQKSKILTHVHCPVHSIPVPTQRFSYVHIDIIGPLPSSQGYAYLLTMMDKTTHWSEVVPLSSISAKSCVRAFISTWISSRPHIRPRFSVHVCNLVWSMFFFWGFQPLLQPPSILKVMDLFELFHRSLKSSLQIRFKLVLSSFAGSLGFESNTKGGHRPFSVPGCLWISVNFTWRTSGCSRDSTRYFLKESKKCKCCVHCSSSSSYLSWSSVSTPCSPCSSQVRFCSRRCIYTYPDSSSISCNW